MSKSQQREVSAYSRGREVAKDEKRHFGQELKATPRMFRGMFAMGHAAGLNGSVSNKTRKAAGRRHSALASGRLKGR